MPRSCGSSRSSAVGVARLAVAVAAALLGTGFLILGPAPLSAGIKDGGFARSPVDVCVGDCGQDGHVSVDELLTMVNGALGIAPASRCPGADRSSDGVITVDEIILAVINALNGCLASPTPSMTDTPTSSPSPEETATDTATPGEAGGIIRDVVISKSKVCSGEEMLVSVDTAPPEIPGSGVGVSINGRAGAAQYLQFRGEPGPRVIVVSAATSEKETDLQERVVEVVECAPDHESLDLFSGPNRFDHYVVDFDLTNASAFAGQDPAYLWDFGDGGTAETGVPHIEHSYGAAIDRDAPYSSFQASLTLRRSGHPDLVVHKTVTIHNLYAVNKQRGLIQPPVQHDEAMQLADGEWRATYTITNPEDEPITLDTRRLILRQCNPDGTPTEMPDTAIKLIVGARKSVVDEVSIPEKQVATDICGVELVLTGKASAGATISVPVQFTLRMNELMMRLVSDAMQDLLNDVVKNKLTADPFHVTEEELLRLQRQGQITLPELSVGGPAPAFSAARLNGDTDVIGQPCRPGDTPPRTGITCQATGDWMVAPPHIANARKGDVIMSPGCGLIGTLLRQVQPPQRYSHVGIMSKDFYEVRHSTASADRYYSEVDEDGFNADILSWGWPGTITQSVSQAFNGQTLTDPFDVQRSVDGFSPDPARCPGDADIAPALVLKPPPGAPAEARKILRQAADIALATDGHYRLYAYSNGSIVIDDDYDAPPDLTPWPANTRASICSEFVWYSLREAGALLEGPDLEAADVAQGAERDDETMDGLYLFTEAERRNAGNWLYGFIYNLVFDQAGWLGNLLSDAADNTANQMVNCFASDFCSRAAINSDVWRSPGVGRTVGPDQMLFWDGPDTGGVLGYNEPMVYRGGDYVAVTTWQVSPGVGSIRGVVLDRGNPVADASVTIAGIELFTNSEGIFEDDMIPAGDYEIVASKLIGGLFMSERRQITINAGERTAVDLTLRAPEAYYRRVVVQGSIYIVDVETIGSNETETVPFYEVRSLDPFQRNAGVGIDRCVGSEVRAVVSINLHLEESDNATVRVTQNGQLYEGTSCTDDDLDATLGPATIHVSAGATSSWSGYMLNPEWDGGDSADWTYTISNQQQTYP